MTARVTAQITRSVIRRVTTPLPQRQRLSDRTWEPLSPHPPSIKTEAEGVSGRASEVLELKTPTGNLSKTPDFVEDLI